MKITSRKFNLSEANKFEIEEKLSKYASRVIITINPNTKEFEMKALVIIYIPNKSKVKMIVKKGNDFHQVLQELSKSTKTYYLRATHLAKVNRKRIVKIKHEQETCDDDVQELVDLQPALVY